MNTEDFQAIENATLTGTSVELSKKTKVNRICDSNFIDCDLLLDPKGIPSSRFGSRFYIKRNVFERCVIRANGRIHKLNVAESNIFKNCKFAGGPFTEPVFGSGTLSDSENVELLESCDFTECDLRDARFYKTSFEKIKLPRWPYIAIIARDGNNLYATRSELYPAFSRILDEVTDFDWGNEKMGTHVEFAARPVGERDNAPSIAVYHAEDIVRFSGASIEVLKADLDRFAHPAFRY